MKSSGSIRCGTSSARASQQGQALTEFLAISVVLVPLFLLIPVIAKYQDIAHFTQLAARYATFDAMVRNDAQNNEKPLGQLQDEVRRRFFSTADAPIKTNDVAGDFANYQSAFWRDPVNKPLIASFGDVTVNRSTQSASDRLPAFVYSFGKDGISSASVQVNLANLPAGLKFYEPFDTINLSMTRSASVLVDGWAGSSPAAVEQKFSEARYFPGAVLAPLSLIVNPVMLLVEPGVAPPNLGQVDFWRDTVPADRLTMPAGAR